MHLRWAQAPRCSAPGCPAQRCSPAFCPWDAFVLFLTGKKKSVYLCWRNGAFNAVPKPEDPRFPISSTGVGAPGCAEAPTASPSLRLVAHGRQGCADSPTLLQSPGAHKLSLCSACLSALSPEMMVHLRIISSSGELPPSSLKLSIFKMPAASRIKKPRLMYRCLQCIIQSPFFASLL